MRQGEELKAFTGMKTRLNRPKGKSIFLNNRYQFVGSVYRKHYMEKQTKRQL
jgi:hypothetical protein